MGRLSLALLAVVVANLIAVHAIANPHFREEQSKVRLLASAIKLYSEDHNGKMPDDLIQMRNYFDLSKALGNDDSEWGPFTQRYAILSNTDTITVDDKKIVLLGTRPIFESTDENQPSPGGRFMGVISESGIPDAIWRSEEEVAELIESNQIKLTAIGGIVPEPSQAIEREATEYQKRVLESLGQQIGTSSKSELTEIEGVPTNKLELNDITDIASSTGKKPAPALVDKNESTSSFPWLLVSVIIILLAVIGVIGFKVLGKSS